MAILASSSCTTSPSNAFIGITCAVTFTISSNIVKFAKKLKCLLLRAPVCSNPYLCLILYLIVLVWILLHTYLLPPLPIMIVFSLLWTDYLSLLSSSLVYRLFLPRMLLNYSVITMFANLECHHLLYLIEIVNSCLPFGNLFYLSSNANLLWVLHTTLRLMVNLSDSIAL